MSPTVHEILVLFRFNCPLNISVRVELHGAAGRQTTPHDKAARIRRPRLAVSIGLGYQMYNGIAAVHICLADN